MRTKELKLVITFNSTTAAMGFETYCKRNQIAGRLIPLPREISAGCGLSWCTTPNERPIWEEVLKNEQIITDGMYELFL